MISQSPVLLSLARGVPRGTEGEGYLDAVRLLFLVSKSHNITIVPGKVIGFGPVHFGRLTARKPKEISTVGQHSTAMKKKKNHTVTCTHHIHWYVSYSTSRSMGLTRDLLEWVGASELCKIVVSVAISQLICGESLTDELQEVVGYHITL